jgi:MYXO-CTERM domain-containing protein
VSGRAVRAISWVVVPLVVVLTLGQIYLSALNRAGDAPGAAGIVVSTLPDLLALGLLALGLLVVHRRPANPVGWIIAGTVVTVGLSDFVESYAVYALYTDPGSLPGGETMALVSNWIFIPALFAAPSMLFLLFPDGKLVSRRWIPVFWVVILTTCAAITTSIFQPVLNDPPFEGVVNPLGFAPPQALLAPLSYIGWPGMAASFLVAAFAMILRLRRSHGVERQQLKWLAAAAAILPLGSVSGVVLYYLGYDSIAGFLAVFSIVPIFLAAGYAILRYRLYDIDLIINRTLVYGSLTATLVALYFGGVATTQALFRALTGQEQQPQLAVVVSTLVIAALFSPLRRRIQAFIDRRFYRKKYDAAKTLESFSAKLRDETDLEALNAELLSVIRETMQPEHLSVWLREPEKGA